MTMTTTTDELDDLWNKTPPDDLPDVAERPQRDLWDVTYEQTAFTFDTDVRYSKYGNEHRVYGPPGTGKTFYLRTFVEHWDKTHRDARYMLISMTRSAGAGLAHTIKLSPTDFAGTLHSACHRLFGRPPIAELKVEEFNSLHPSLALSKSRNLLTGDDSDVPTSHQPGDPFMEIYQLLRTKMIPRDQWPRQIAAFVTRYEEWKLKGNEKEGRYYDFTDLLEEALRMTEHAPGNPTVIAGDESQDWGLLPLTLVRKWGNHPSVERFILVGDADQCQPEGTMVRTTHRGEVPIEDLDPDIDQLTSYDQNGAYMVGLSRSGRKFKKTSRHYTGQLYTVGAFKYSSRATYNHLWLTRWNKPLSDKAHVVYLMRQGKKFRVGWCKLFNSEGTFHLGQRARLEKADAAWIIRIFDNKIEASIWESIIAARYGLPLVMFEGTFDPQYHYTKENLDFIFEQLQGGNEYRAHSLLASCNLDIKFPIWSKRTDEEQKGRGQGVTKISLTASCNLISDYMLIPVPTTDKFVTWEPITVSSEPFEGTVYSLEVDRDETYVADGLVTHNCLYRWTGADPEDFFALPLPPQRITVLEQSYRVPQEPLTLALKWIRRVKNRPDVSYNPRRVKYPKGEFVQGKVTFLNGADFEHPERAIDLAWNIAQSGKSAGLMFSCGYMAYPSIDYMRHNKLPFSNPWRISEASWNSVPPGGKKRCTATDRVLAFLRPQVEVWGDEARMWTGDDLSRWVEYLKADGVAKKKMKGRIEELKNNFELVTVGSRVAKAAILFDAVSDDAANNLALENLLTDEAIAAATSGDLEWLRSVLGTRGKPMDYPIDVAQRHGGKVLVDRPGLYIGTIHSFKGHEFHSSILFPDLSTKFWQQYCGSQIERDDSVRLAYVALTRCIDELVICQPATSKNWSFR